MAIKMTLEEARQREREWQEELSEVSKLFQSLKRRNDVDAMELYKVTRRVDEAKNALEFYNGYVIYEPKRDENGREVYDENGNRIYTDRIKESRLGYIQQMASNAQKLKKKSNLGERFDSRTFATFDKGRDLNAYEQASRYAEMDNLFTDRGNGRIFIGGTGTGKTHLAASITNVLVDREIPVLFGTFSEHLSKIKAGFGTPASEEYLSDMKSTTMLVIDDLGAEIDRDWGKSILYDVINYRYEHRLPIVITTNLTTEALGVTYGDRIYSRLLETCKVIKMSGTDYRAGGRKSGKK